MKPGETKDIRQISSYSELTADGSLMFIFFCYDLPSLCHLQCHRKRIKLSNNNALCLKTDSNASDASVMHSFWQNTVESEIQTRIMEFAATTMGEVYLLSPANNGTKYSTRILTQQTSYGTELQNDTMGTIDETSGFRNYGFSLQT